MAENSVQVELSIEEQKALRALATLSKRFEEFGDNAQKSIKKSDMALASFAGNLAATAAQKGLGLIADAFANLGGFIVDSAKAAAESETSLNRLNVSLAQTGILTEETSKRFQDLASEIQATTAFEDDAVIASAALIQSLGRLSSDGLERATKAATDLAATFNLDLETASRLVGKAAEGNTTALGKLGIEFAKGSTDAETFANVLQTIEQRFGGAAKEQARTFAGAIAQLSNVWGDLKETVGGIIIQNPAVIAAFNTLKSVIIQAGQAVANAFSAGNDEAVANFFRITLDGAFAVTVAADTIVRAFTGMSDAVMAAIRIMAMGITAPIAGVLELLAKIPMIGDAFRGAADAATNELMRLSSAFDKNVEGLSNFAVEDTILGGMATSIAEARNQFDVFYNDVKNKSPELRNNLSPQNEPVDETALQKQRELNNAILDLDNQLMLARNQMAFENDLLEQERIVSRNAAQIEQLQSFELTKSELIYQNQLKQNELLKTAEETALANQKALREKELRDLQINQKTKADIRQKELRDQEAFFSAAISLSNSNSKELALIGKASALANLAIKTPEAIASSFAFGARIGGPPLGFAFGAIAATAMAAQAAQIAGAKFANGGIVGGTSYNGDRVSAQVNSGEMILNRQQQTKLFNDINNGGGGGNVVEAINALGDRIARMNIVVQANSREIARLVRDEREAGFAI